MKPHLSKLAVHDSPSDSETADPDQAADPDQSAAADQNAGSQNAGSQNAVAVSSERRPSSAVEDLRPEIESALADACQFDAGCPERLGSAMRYALLAPGKRLRPAMVLMAAEACSQAESESGEPTAAQETSWRDLAMPGAVAVEMIHAYSLIHDDLPAMDDDDLRRGRPTVHIEFDEATAILAGDALLAQAFVHLSSHIRDPRVAADAIAALSLAAGPLHLVGGQADDLAAESEDWAAYQAKHGLQATISHLESIHRRKTGALFAASLELGAILASGSHHQRDALRRFALDLGLAFQVVDDLLDFTADDASLGKRAGKDADRGKLTYPGLLGLDGARERAKELVESAKSHAIVFGRLGWRLTWLADYVLERTH